MATMIALIRVIGALIGQTSPVGVLEPSMLLVAMVGAVAVIALATTARIGLGAEADRPPSATAPDLDLSVLLTQSDPDADGHTRSRAPGLDF